MKLAIATTAAALIISTAASAMTSSSIVDPRDAALGALGQVTTGSEQVVSVEAYGLDGRSEALLKGDTVAVTTFEATSQMRVSDIR